MHRDTDVRTFPDRLFSLSDVEPDRLEVVLRSEGETNIDAWFSVTRFLSIPMPFEGMEISRLDEAAGDRVLRYRMPLFVGRIPDMRMRRLIEDDPTLPWPQVPRLAERG